MKKLLYKGIEFDVFQLYNGEPERYGDCNTESLDGFESVDVYVCPHCIKKYGLYAECGTTEEKVNEQIEMDMECNYHDLVCGVEGCYNRNSLDGYFTTEECQLVDVESDFTDGNFIDDAEKMRDFKILSKEEFLSSYSYLTEEEYDNTMEIFKKLPKEQKQTTILEMTIESTSENTFDLEVYEPESGEFIRINCHDNITETENQQIIDEIKSWVSLMREEA